jgi:hypothetical protein
MCGCKVVDAVVHHISDLKMCHEALLGEKKVSIWILHFEESCGEKPLPFLYSRANTIAELVGTVIV